MLINVAHSLRSPFHKFQQHNRQCTTGSRSQVSCYPHGFSASESVLIKQRRTVKKGELKDSHHACSRGERYGSLNIGENSFCMENELESLVPVSNSYLY